MSRPVFRLLLMLSAVPWTLTLYAALQMYRLDLHLGHGICGPWGCGPRMEALIGYHIFWLVLMLPIVIAAGAFLPNAVSRWLGLALLTIGLLVMVGYIGFDASRYVSQARSAEYLWQHCLLTLVTTVDLPMMQLALMGLILYARPSRNQTPVELVGQPNLLQSESSDPVAPMQTTHG